MKKISLEAYSFDELSFFAKEQAHQNYLKNCQFDWAYEALSSIKEGLLRVFRLKLSNYALDWENPCASTYDFSGLRYYEEEYCEEQSIKAVQAMFEGHPYLYKDGKETYCSLTGMCYDESFLKPLRDIMRITDETHLQKEICLIDIVHECIYSLLYDVRDEIKRERSMETFEEICRENDYLFDEEGNIIF